MQVLFLHGGYGTQTVQSDTLFLSVAADGSMRIRSLCGPSAPGPGPRGCHAAVYVPPGRSCKGAGSKVYTFGGLSFAEDGSAVFLSDVHVLDLMSMEWSEVACTGSPPSPRAHCFTFKYGYLY